MPTKTFKIMGLKDNKLVVTTLTEEQVNELIFDIFTKHQDAEPTDHLIRERLDHGVAVRVMEGKELETAKSGLHNCDRLELGFMCFEGFLAKPMTQVLGSEALRKSKKRGFRGWRILFDEWCECDRYVILLE